MSSIINRIKKLEELATDESCDGNCDIKYPYKKCKYCMSRSVLNEIHDLLCEVENDGIISKE